MDTTLDEGYSMETSQRDVLLGTITWWGFHALLMWMGVWHFLSRDLTDGALFASDLFAGGLIGATVLSLLRLSVGCHLLVAGKGRMGQPDRCGHLGIHVLLLWPK
jgi:hypothetical protein